MTTPSAHSLLAISEGGGAHFSSALFFVDTTEKFYSCIVRRWLRDQSWCPSICMFGFDLPQTKLSKRRSSSSGKSV